MENKAILLGHYGGDKTHALSAWQSTGLELGNLPPDERIDSLFDVTVGIKKRQMPELLKMLAKDGHHTPFEKSTLHFQVTADIATHIHCLKHRIGVSINTESARYKELDDKWHIPDDWESEVVEMGLDHHQLIQFLIDDEVFTWEDALNKYCELGHKLYHEAINQLAPKLGRKRAKESARYFLPYAKQVDFDMMFNFRSFIHFQGLRNSEHAQKEVMDVAAQMLEQVKAIPGNPFEHSLAAFGY